jgi:DNA-binding NarL/FixJ family response regulator
MLSAGADGYVNKNESPELILEAIRKVSRGENYVSRKLAETVLFNMTRDNGPVRLSSREYQVLYLFGSGLGTKQIAGQLDLSVKTISTYRYRLLEKLKLTTNAQLMRYAITEGVLSD